MSNRPVPTAPVGVTWTWHVAEVAEPETAESVHGLVVEACMLSITETNPTGVLGVPEEVSVTVTVHVAGLLTTTEDGVQLTVVVVDLVTVIVPEVPVLEAWTPSLGV